MYSQRKAKCKIKISFQVKISRYILFSLEWKPECPG